MAKEAEAARDARAKVTNVYFISVVKYASYNVIGAQLEFQVLYYFAQLLLQILVKYQNQGHFCNLHILRMTL